MKRVLSAFLCVLMLVSLLGVFPAVAASEDDIASIQVDDFDIIEGTHGYFSTTEEGGETVTRWEYDIMPDTLTVTLKNGTELTGSPDEIGRELGVWPGTLRESGELEVGHTYPVSIYYGDLDTAVKGEYNITVVESPVDHIEFSGDMTAIFEWDGSWQSVWVDGEYEEHAYFYYNCQPDFIDVYYKDDSFESKTMDELQQEYGYQSLWIEDGQSAETPWGIGDHTVKFTFLGYTAEYVFSVVESPVSSIAVEPVTYIEGTDGYHGYFYNEETGDWEEDPDIWLYYLQPDSFTVNFKDSSVFTGTPNEFEEQYGAYPNFYSDQSEETPWGLGEHTVTVSVLGATGEYKINIVESPVKAISVDDMTIVEGTNGYESTEYDDEGNETTVFIYNLLPGIITVTLKDGTVVTKTPYELSRDYDDSLSYYDDQHEQPWGIGEHTVTCSFMGKSTTFKVNVIENPVKEIVVPKLTLIEGANGYTEYDDGKSYYHYNTNFDEKIAVVMKDGSKLEGYVYDISSQLREEYGEGIMYVTDQSYENPWGVGVHKAYLEILGKQFPYDVEIVKSPVKSVAVDDMILYEGVDVYTYDDHVSYALKDPTGLKVTLNDGTVLTGEDYGVEWNGTWYYARNVDYPDTSGWKVGGTYDVPMSIMGYTFNVKAKVVAFPYNKIEISGDDKLTLKLYKADGSFDTESVDRFYGYGGEEVNGARTSIFGEMITDRHEYSNVTFFYDTNDLAYYGNVQLKMGGYESNKLNGSSWLRFNMIARNTAYTLYYKSHIYDSIANLNGAIDQKSLAAAVEAFATYGDFEYEDGTYVLDAAEFKKVLANYFAYDFDVTKYKGYKDGKLYVSSPDDSYDSDESPKDNVKYANGEWTVTLTDKEKTLTVVFNKKILITSVTFSDAKPQVSFKDVKAGAFYEDAVNWAVANGVTSGTSDTTFSPDNNCTRGQVVTFLWRAAGSPEPTKTSHPFTDVKSTAYYYKAMLWAVEKGVTNGISATSFGPNKTCTRGQVVTFLWRAKGQPKPTNTKHSFKDVSEKGFYYTAMLWAVEKGVTNGVSDTKFAPDRTCTRGQVVTFLYRAFK